MLILIISFVILNGWFCFYYKSFNDADLLCHGSCMLMQKSYYNRDGVPISLSSGLPLCPAMPYWHSPSHSFRCVEVCDFLDVAPPAHGNEALTTSSGTYHAWCRQRSRFRERIHSGVGKPLLWSPSYSSKQMQQILKVFLEFKLYLSVTVTVVGKFHCKSNEFNSIQFNSNQFK